MFFQNLVPFLYFISPPVCFQSQVVSICYKVSSTSHPVSHTIALTKFLFSDGYQKWLSVYCPIINVPYAVYTTFLYFRNSGESHRACFYTFALNLFIKNYCILIKLCKYLLFADDNTTFHVILSVVNPMLLQSDVENIQGWNAANLLSNSRKLVMFCAPYKILHRLDGFLLLFECKMSIYVGKLSLAYNKIYSCIS